MGFFGDLLGSVLQPVGTLLGGASQAIGIPAPIGAAAGGFLGGKAGDLARRLPFEKGSKVSKQSRPKKIKSKPAKAPKGKVAKGSAAAKAKMAKVRAAKKK